MLHPAVAHFAMSLPIISLLLGVIYLIKPSELMSKISTRFMVVSSVAIIIAFFSGKNDGSEVFALLSPEGQEVLKNHKELGTYLAMFMPVVAMIKIFGCKTKRFKVELLAVILVATVAVSILAQGKMGGEITYKYGAHVEKYADGMECLASEAEMDDDE